MGTPTGRPAALASFAVRIAKLLVPFYRPIGLVTFLRLP